MQVDFDKEDERVDFKFMTDVDIYHLQVMQARWDKCKDGKDGNFRLSLPLKIAQELHAKLGETLEEVSR